MKSESGFNHDSDSVGGEKMAAVSRCILKLEVIKIIGFADKLNVK